MSRTPRTPRRTAGQGPLRCCRDVHGRKIEELRTSSADKTATGFFLSRVEDVTFFLFFFGCWIVLCAHVFISVIMSDDCSWTSWWKCWSRWSACRGSEKADGSENSLYCTLLCFMILDYTLLYFFIVCVAFFCCSSYLTISAWHEALLDIIIFPAAKSIPRPKGCLKEGLFK